MPPDAAAHTHRPSCPSDPCPCSSSHTKLPRGNNSLPEGRCRGQRSPTAHFWVAPQPPLEEMHVTAHEMLRCLGPLREGDSHGTHWASFQNTAEQGGHAEQSGVEWGRRGGRRGDEAHSCRLRRRPAFHDRPTGARPHGSTQAPDRLDSGLQEREWRSTVNQRIGHGGCSHATPQQSF